MREVREGGRAEAERVEAERNVFSATARTGLSGGEERECLVVRI